MRARVFGAQRRQRILSPNEEKTTKIFFYEKRKEKDEMYDVVTRDIIFIK